MPLMGGTTTSFIATHPFLFFIMDSETSTVIFAGKLSQPKSVEEPESNTGFTSGQGFGNSSQLTESPDGIPHPTTSSPSNSRTPPKPGKYHFDEHVDVGSSSDLQEFSPSRRGHAHRPKFRSIKGAFPQRDGPSQRPHFYFSPEQLNNLLNHSPVKKTNNNEVNASFENNQNSGYTSEIFGPENQRQAKEDKREKALKGQNSRDPTSDTWRHHILFFS